MPDSIPPQTPSPTPQQLVAFIREFFNQAELKDLCFELEIDFDELDGSNKRDKTRELVQYMTRESKLEKLREIVESKKQESYAQRFPSEPPPPTPQDVDGPNQSARPWIKRVPIWGWALGVLALSFVVLAAVLYFKWSSAMDADESTLREPTAVSATLEVTEPLAPTITPSTTPQLTVFPTDVFGIRTVSLPNGTKVEQILAPGGSFKMGSSRGDGDEKPLHEVAVNSFWLDRTEVTNRQFAEFIQATGYTTTAELEGSGRIFSDGNFRSMFGSDWRHPAGSTSNLSGLEDHPAVLISWIDADKYCRWVGGRLPTEAEWEYAARGPNTLTYPWGHEFESLRANYCDRSCLFDWASERYDDGYIFTSPVGSFREGGSWIGAEDMAGNVWEWVQDWYAEYYYASSPAFNPSGPQLGQYKILRGGAWASSNSYGLRTAAREFNYPNYSDSSYGFRCAYED